MTWSPRAQQLRHHPQLAALAALTTEALAATHQNDDAVSRCIPDRSAASPVFPCFANSSISFLTCASVVCKATSIHPGNGLREATQGALSDVEM